VKRRWKDESVEFLSLVHFEVAWLLNNFTPRPLPSVLWDWCTIKVINDLIIKYLYISITRNNIIFINYHKWILGQLGSVELNGVRAFEYLVVQLV